MRIGLTIANFGSPGGARTLGAALANVARYAEEAGFDSLWVWDHFFWDESPVGPGVTDREMIEAYTTLGFIAGVTRTIKLGAMVTGVTYRHPGVLVKQVTTLDVVSQGRAYFGVGAAWFEEEHRALGVPFPSLDERFERLEETLQIAHQMWADEGQYNLARPYHGNHYRLERTLNVPQAIQRPHPPVLVGGLGERWTLRLVAQYADACNFYGALERDALLHKLDVLRGHCARLGRSYDAIEKTVYDWTLKVGRESHPGTRSPQQVISYFKTLADVGVDTIIVDNVSMDFFDPDVRDAWATAIIPAVHALQVAGR
jgi:F420-dependent oxidoreductase-like protein